MAIWLFVEPLLQVSERNASGVEPLLRVSERKAILVWAFPSGSNLGVATFDARGSWPERTNT
ncbi:MAG: hypothetical protein J6J06_01090 [Bacteroidaceae bacterium]|nr:hypothetical protein [Bacteroidaceae bacterium]